MNVVPFVLFVIPDYVDKKFVKPSTTGCESQIVYSLKEMESCIFNNTNINLIIIDSGLINSQNDERLVTWISVRKMIPVIVMVDSDEDAVRAIEMKARDFISKPVVPQLLKHQIDRIITHMMEVKMNSKITMNINDELKEKSKGLAELQAGIIGVLSEIIEFRDFETNSHNIRSQAYVEVMIRKMIDVPNPYQREICLWDIQDHILSAQLHDIGKIIIPNEILTKPCTLTNAEYEVVKTHVVIGVNIIDKIIEKVGSNSYLTIARKYIESHHEHWDGSGYPQGLHGEQIPDIARVVGLIEAYSALTENRAYRKALTTQEALKVIQEEQGKKFDPHICQVFLDNIDFLEKRYEEAKMQMDATDTMIELIDAYDGDQPIKVDQSL